MDPKLEAIDVGFQAYLDEGGEDFGAVREVAPDGRDEVVGLGQDVAVEHVVVYVENAGDFIVPLRAIRSAHDGKVVLDAAELDQRLRDAIAHEHDREEPGL